MLKKCQSILVQFKAPLLHVTAQVLALWGLTLACLLTFLRVVVSQDMMWPEMQWSPATSTTQPTKQAPFLFLLISHPGK